MVRIELSGGREQADISFTDEIDERQPAVLVFFRDGDDEAQIALDEFLKRVGVARADLAGDVDFFRSFEERIGGDFVEVLIENVALGLAWGDSRRARRAAFALRF